MSSLSLSGKVTLRGWEFTDVAAMKFSLKRKEVPFDRKTGGN